MRFITIDQEKVYVSILDLIDCRVKTHLLI